MIYNVLWLYNVDLLCYIFFQDSLVEQSSQGSFVVQGRKDILTTALGTDELPGRVRTAGYGVGVRQYFGSIPQYSSSQNTNIAMEISRIKDELRSQIDDELTSQIKDELRQQIRRKYEELSQQQQHTPLQEGVIVPIRGKASTKGSCAVEDEEEEDTNTDTSYRCKLFVGDPPQLVVIGRVFSMSSTLHTMPLGDDFARVVVEEVREADAEVPVTTSEVRLVREALGTFIVWPTHLLQPISIKTQVL